MIVEGLGMNLLRLLADGKAVGEFRFTLRQAREVAKLQRRLERQIEGKEEEAAEAGKPRGEEKKIRCDKCGRVIPPWSEVCPACLSRRKVLSRLLDFVKPYKWLAIVGVRPGRPGDRGAVGRAVVAQADDGPGPGPQPRAPRRLPRAAVLRTAAHVRSLSAM